MQISAVSPRASGKMGKNWQETFVTKSFHSFAPAYIIEMKHYHKGPCIRQKADELFMRYGIRSVSMDDIASQLGMSKNYLPILFR